MNIIELEANVKIVAIILTYNEEKHLSRCLSNVMDVVDEVYVIDCYSSDATVDIARSYGAHILANEWVNHAHQFNWALSQLDNIDWVLRIDADEVITDELKNQIKNKLHLLDSNINGVYLNRRINFLGHEIKYGGVFPTEVLRLFRFGYGECEYRWMDEHIKVEGQVTNLSGEIIDDNLNSLTWWTEKHNKYSSLEAIEMLNLEYRFMGLIPEKESRIKGKAGIKRWIKDKIYAQLPGGCRAFIYFLYRYVLRFGFLDGSEGSAFHILQGFWYRYLVDVKVAEVKDYSQKNKVSIPVSIERLLGIKVKEKSNTVGS
ncbi:glycosyltransferase family 2 protein [Cobetia sp. 3AK]|uniref:glycosyltransferase family 2 protein n=1 Tax=Cobetia sp. 3AK TaxID=3040020 RepID=UPI00244AF43A|nr:glycosyltransferase family 2 protein [Cobetia sp. 3AK]MDH2373881.1 glycosyltransferase family 2 protein [Cobetia sp. 3AK]